ncbi:MAG: hypothetical protein M1818_007816 [Claussenomyces sp. TS43310]|nr:MAG: hypothetical protein M1818_007816 [Claussenomyces sp. TS43310]
MPAFLQLSRPEIQAKFAEITWKERNRLAQSEIDPSPTSQWARAQSPHTRFLDRYANIHPWYHNRIRLRVPAGHSDYINASPITVQSRKTGRESRYIAMQGPKEDSTSHVWRMVWHELESPAVIVMLTETHEAGQEKCYQYFPKTPRHDALHINEHDEFGDGFRATVRCTEETITGQGGAIEVRKLVLKVDGEEEEKVIWHLFYTKWPDFGVPAGEDLEEFFALMKLSEEKNKGPENPRIIHCSAGVGRSGTFITLEHLLSELEAGSLEVQTGGDETEDDLIFETVNNLRMQRRMMVQADTQYHFIYQVIKHLWEEKYTPSSGRSTLTRRREEEEDIFN